MSKPFRELLIILILFYPLMLDKTSIRPEQFLTRNDKISYPVIGLKAIELNNDDRAGFSSTEIALINKFNIPIIAISLDYIYMSSLSVEEGERLCVQEVKISISDDLDVSDDYGIFHGDQIIFSDNNEHVCFENGYTDIVNEKNAYRPMLLKNPEISEYYYPFDARLLSFDLLFKGYIEKANNQKKIPDEFGVKITLAPSRWSTKIAEGPNYIDGYVAKEVLVTLKRPWYYRLLFFIIPAIIVIALLSLISIESLGSFWEVSIGFISLWSVHEILIPNYVNSPTIIDQVITFLYLLLGFVVLASLISVFRHKEAIDLVYQIPARRSKPNLIKWAENLIDRKLTSPEEIAKALFMRADIERSVAIKNKLRDIAEIYVRHPDG